VRRVVEALAVYPNWDDLRRQYPELESEDIRQALEFTAHNTEVRFRTTAASADHTRSLAVLGRLDDLDRARLLMGDA
jgi:hypothetical protein